MGEVEAVKGDLVDVVVPGGPDDAIRWVESDPKATLGDEEPNPVYDEDDRLWHLRFRPQAVGTAVLHLVRERPTGRRIKLRINLRVRPPRTR